VTDRFCSDIAIEGPKQHVCKASHWPQAKIKIIPCTHFITVYLCHIHIGAIPNAHPIRGALCMQQYCFWNF